MKNYLVVDKSFLQSCSKDQFGKTSEKYNILMTEELLYEIAQHLSTRRASLFSKFTDKGNPFYLTKPLSVALQYEMREQKPYGQPSKHIAKIDYTNHKKYSDKNYQLTNDEKNAIAQKRNATKMAAEAFFDGVFGRMDYFKNEFRGFRGKNKENKIEKMEIDLVSDRSIIIEQYKLLDEKPFRDQGVKKPDPDVITDNWYIYRWLQLIGLFSIDLASRHVGAPPVTKLEVAEKIQHDMLDLACLIFGIGEGNFAADERKLIRWFNLMCPGGTIETTHSN
jgi:hypothetical protein